MRTHITTRHLKAATILAGMALSFAAFTPVHAGEAPPFITEAVADASRPDADKQRDADRMPADVMAFAGIKTGDKVGDLLPGGGYFTRLFSKTVGARGKVFAIIPKEVADKRPNATEAVSKIAAEPGYSNVKVTIAPLDNLDVNEPLDVVWTSLNYHDLQNKSFNTVDMAAFNKAVYATLKPGGTYIIIDHKAAPGSGKRDTETLHRIDVEQVKQDVLAAGFKLNAESNLLAHPQDNHTGKVFDSGLRGKTDQFILKFRKP
jgi:predicted methyltransferase